MSAFAHYLLTLFTGQKRWHLLVCILLFAQLLVSYWLLQQKSHADDQHVSQLLALNSSSAHIANHAVVLSQLKLTALEKLSHTVESYQQQLDVLRPYYRQKKQFPRQTFEQLDIIWQPIRESAEKLLSYSEELTSLRATVEETDQRLPELLSLHDSIINGLYSLATKPASLKLLQEQRLMLHRMAANVNAVTGGVLSGVDANARSAIASSIESDLFLLEKSLGLVVADNKAALDKTDKVEPDVSLLAQVEGLAEQLHQLTLSVRDVIAATSVIREVNKSAQLLVEDSGLLLKPTQELLAYQKYLSQEFTTERVWVIFSVFALLIWLFYMGFQRLGSACLDVDIAQKETERLQLGVDDVAKQMASFSEGDHSIVVRSKIDGCQHLVEQANRMIEYVGGVDKQIVTDYLPIIKRLINADSEMATTIDRQTNDIARLSAELNNIVAGQTSGSALLGSYLAQSKAHIQELSVRAKAAGEKISGLDGVDSIEAAVHTVRQLQSHISDRLETLSELSQRINLDVVDASALLVGRTGGDRAVRRAIEQLQLLTARYQGLVDDVLVLLADMNSTVVSLLDKGGYEHQCYGELNELSQVVVSRVTEIEQCNVRLLAAMDDEDKQQAQQAETISLVLDELQDGNQRLAVVAMDSDVGIKRLNKLASEHANVAGPSEGSSPSKVEGAS